MSKRIIEVDIAILGGGVSGLWLLDHLINEGYSALLFERNELGTGQTIVSQGMIHGGVKYALEGRLTSSSESIASMPDIWRSCLNGTGHTDISATKVLSQQYYMWSNQSLTNKLMAFLGSKALRGRIERLQRNDYPPAFSTPEFRGALYALNELVLDVPSLLACLAEKNQPQIWKLDNADDQIIQPNGSAPVGTIAVAPGIEVKASRYIFTAGTGNRQYIESIGFKQGMQKRPLHQVFVKHRNPHPLFAHCIGRGSKPQLTVTTHQANDGYKVWNLGGELAESGVARTDQEQLDAARQILAQNLPWVNLSDSQWATHRVERAEPTTNGLRPDAAFVKTADNCMVCWPVKLSLVPQLADKVSEQLRQDGVTPDNNPQTIDLHMAKPVVAEPIWETIWRGRT